MGVCVGMCVCMCGRVVALILCVKGPILSISIITAHKEEEIESSRGGEGGFRRGRWGFRRGRCGAEGLGYHIR